MFTAFCSEIVTDSIILLHIFNICLANGEALDHTLWRTCFVRGRETIVRLRNEWMKIGIFYCVWKCLNLMCDCLETTDTSMITVVLGVAAAYVYIAFMLECILLTYLLTPWSRVLLEKLAGFQLVKKFTAFYGTWRFITTFTSARHLSLSWASSSPGPRLFLQMIRNRICVYSEEELLAPNQTPKLEDHPLSAVHDRLFNIFTTTLNIAACYNC